MLEKDVRQREGGSHGDAARAMFDRIAPTYDKLNRVLSLGIDQSWRRLAVRRLAAGPADQVMDLCAGTLDLTALLARQVPRPARIVAVDFSKEMLDRGAAKVPDVERIVADALQLPFAEGDFTRVIAGFGIRNLSDVAKGVGEVARVLQRGGRFVTLEFFKPTRADARLFHAAYARHILPRVGGLLSGDRGAYAYLRDSMNAFYTRAEYEEMLRQAGYIHVKGEDLFWGIGAIVSAERPS
jgi:ubiquinone/menaquinone biosynthesis methyltransferase